MTHRQIMGGLARDAVAREGRLARVKYTSGMVVRATVRNLREEAEHAYDGKSRPVVVIGRSQDNDGWDGSWRCMGLTTKATFETGRARVPIIHWSAIPLPGPGYLWSPRLPIVPGTDMLEQIGWLTMADAEQIIEYSALTVAERDGLRAVARPNP